MAISQEALLGQLIPEINIEGITLESSGELPLIDNPHILDSRENAAKINSQQPSDKGLTAVVDLSIKEVLGNDMIGDWLREQKFHKYLKILVFKTTSTGLIDLFSYSQNMINFATEGVNSQYTLSADEVIKLFQATGKGTFTSAYQYLTENLEKRELSVVLDSVGAVDTVSTPTTVDSDGNSIKDYVYRVVFNEEKTPQDMAIFAVSFLDLEAMKQDFDLDFNEGTLENQNGKVASEHILKRGTPVSQSSVYMISQGASTGKVWTGPIHQPTPSTYATGSEPSADSKRLKKRLVSNSKVQDFRQIDEIHKYELPIEALSEAGFTKRKIILSNDKVHVEENNLHFTNLWLSRDSSGAARFMFGVDINSLIRHNSVYGSLLEDTTSSISEAVVNKTKVKSLKIMRRRVKSIETMNHLGSPSTTEVLFNKRDPYTSLVISGASENNELNEVSITTASVREAFPVVEDQPVGMKYYTAHDKEMSTVTDGLYQYGLQIEIEDGIVKHLEDTLTHLVEQQEKLREYLSHASKVGMTKKLLEVNDPHINSTRERYSYSISSKGHYNPTTNRFTEKFTDFCETKYDSSDLPWVEGVMSYIRGLSQISGSSSDAFLFAFSLAAIMAPQSGTPRGIMAVIELYDKLISKYNGMVGKRLYAGATTRSDAGLVIKNTYWFQNNVFDSNITKRSGLDYLSDIMKREDFEDAMPLSEYSDLAFGSDQSRGLKIVDGGYWKGRIKTETLKYFEDEQPDLTISQGVEIYTSTGLVSRASYGFLSPAYVVADGRAYSLTLAKPDDYYFTVGLGLLSDGSSGTTSTPVENSTAATNQTEGEKVAQSKYESIYSEFNITIQPLPSYDPQLPSSLENKLIIESLPDACESVQMDAVDPYPAWTEATDGRIVSIYAPKGSYKFGFKNSNFIDFFRKTSEMLVSNNMKAGDMSIAPHENNNKSISNYDLSSKGNFVSKIQTNSQTRNSIGSAIGSPAGSAPEEVVDQMPNQLKSLILGRSGSPQIRQVWGESRDPIVDWRTSAKFILNYEFLTSIERLEGYGELSDASAVRIEKWVPLTEDFYLQSTGKELLCRMKRFVCSELGSGGITSLQAPIYDEYFILQPPVELTAAQAAISTYERMRQQLIDNWSEAAEKISQFGTTNLITGA